MTFLEALKETKKGKKVRNNCWIHDTFLTIKNGKIKMNNVSDEYLSAKPGDELVIERIYKAFEDIGYEIRKPNIMKKSIYSAVDYGVPQDRRRIIIFGVLKGGNISLEKLYGQLTKLKIDGDDEK